MSRPRASAESPAARAATSRAAAAATPASRTGISARPVSSEQSSAPPSRAGTARRVASAGHPPEASPRHPRAAPPPQSPVPGMAGVLTVAGRRPAARSDVAVRRPPGAAPVRPVAG
ncbi:hypothetical protein AB0I37_27875 [Micromonospora purpureochromogenes]|uniref:hypothetical protein n=1 Tax=Micromonospora purpureochromogenes TaxID=47872 RepID=UPI0033C7A9B9